MYLEKINIKKFRVLEDIEVHFQPPNGATADAKTGNVVNVIAGVNGCGKTSLLEAIFQAVSNPHNFIAEKKSGVISISKDGEINEKTWPVLHQLIEQLNKKNQGNFTSNNDARLIVLPSQQSFTFSSVTQLQIAYQFAQKIDTTKILGNAEFYIKEYILNLERESTIANPKARTKAAVEAFNAHFTHPTG